MSDRAIESARLKAWFATHLPDATPPFKLERIAGGRSNLTYRVTDARGVRCILRRGPLGAHLASAHDMGREYRILSALAPTPVPTPRPFALCADASVIGAPFYVMQEVDGLVLRESTDVEPAFTDAERRRVGHALVDTLNILHAVDPAAAGLSDLGRGDNYAARQLRRWKRQWDESKTRDLRSMDETHTILARCIPEQNGVAIVHGDYRLDNTIVTRSGEIAAVVDWELCTLGDPIADLGMLLVYWSEPGDELVPLMHSPTRTSGFPSRTELSARYLDRSGRDASTLDFFVALSRWKLAALLEGVYARSASGAYGVQADDFRPFREIVAALAEMALMEARALD